MKHEVTIITHAIDGLEGIQENSVYGSDLHHHLFNEDYFIIGYYQAEKWLNETGGVFNAIERITNYSMMNFGDVYTDLSSSESVANMYAYILGDELLCDIKHLQDKWDVKLSLEDLKAINDELNELL